eukprot:scaffold1813_cov109-Cylindrotheca_fusiformis.AAC.3
MTEDVAWIYNGQDEVPTTVRRVKIAENLSKIPDEAFKEHQELEEVILSSSLKSIRYQGLEKEEVGIPSSVKVIEDAAFAGCQLLGTLDLNEGLERIGHHAFSCCESLTEVDVPSTVNVVDNYAFQDCRLVARLGLNEGLERIGEYAFIGCDSLSHVRMPQSVNGIETTAFSSYSYWSRSCLISIEFPEECSFLIDLSGCQSLVSLAGPMPTFSWRVDRELFFAGSKLGSLVDNKADLIHRLKHRFDNSPLNKLCYYQSYQSLDGGMTQLRSRMEDGNPLAATSQTDEFGMTPLHVLSLSQTPNLDMLLAVIDAGKPGHMVRIMDSFGCTPMDYLSLNRMPASTEVIRRVLQTHFGQVMGLDQFWKSDMLQAIDEALAVEWSSRKSEVGRVVRKYERKEIISLLELCLWKVKIDGAVSKKVKIDGAVSKKVRIGEATSEKEQILTDRQRCRVTSGADIVISHVLPFLDN